MEEKITKRLIRGTGIYKSNMSKTALLIAASALLLPVAASGGMPAPSLGGGIKMGMVGDQSAAFQGKSPPSIAAGPIVSQSPVTGETLRLTPIDETQKPVLAPEILPVQARVAGTQTPVYRQVRMERRVIIRVSPRRRPLRPSSATAPRRAHKPMQIVERRVGKCLKNNDIAAVRTIRNSRLLLFMRDSRMILANLEKTCSARDFYSGFYFEPHNDGNICINRDQIQSRTGARCSLTRLRQLVSA